MTEAIGWISDNAPHMMHDKCLNHWLYFQDSTSKYSSMTSNNTQTRLQYKLNNIM